MSLLEERVHRILELMTSGVDNDNIALELSIEPDFVEDFSKKIPTNLKIEIINRSISKGLSSLEELCKRVNLKPMTLWSFAKDHNLKIPFDEMEPSPYKPEIDELIPHCLPLDAMGKKIGSTREFIRFYLKATGQHKQWKENRKNSKKPYFFNIVQILNEAVDKKAKGKGFAYQKAVEYVRSLKHIVSGGIPSRSDHLIQLFERYERAINSGEKVSLQKLGEGLFEYPSTISRILKRVGLEPLYGTMKREVVQQDKRELINRAFYSDMSAPDIAYYLQVKCYNVYDNFKKKEKRKNVINSLAPGGIHLPNRLASQIYEAEDLGFKPEEIEDLLDAKEKILHYALENRGILETSIIGRLKFLFSL